MESNEIRNNNINHLAELALIRALPDAIIPQTKPGRLKGKCINLIKVVDKEFSKVPLLNDDEYEEIKQKMIAFGKQTGWEGQQRHIVTLTSFLLTMIEESKFKYHAKITDNLNDIFDYFERAKDAKPLCFLAGDIANMKWKKIVNGEA